MPEVDTHLKLENQICFPLYAVSRLVTQQYSSLLEELDVTYTQYLVLLVLWEKEDIFIKDISEKLFLETNTLTPLLKRMEANDLIERNRSKTDERKVTVSLTQKGRNLKEKATNIPNQLATQFECLSIEEKDIHTLKEILDKILLSAK